MQSISKSRLTFFLAFLFLSAGLQAQLWLQKGIDLDGEAVSDYAGWSVSTSADGNTVAFGANYNNGNGPYSGHVRVFSWNGIAWQQKGADIDGEASFDQSGYAVGLSADGNTVAIGAPTNDGNGSYSGHVRIYTWNGNSWQQKGFDIDGESTLDQSGWSLSLCPDGNTLAIGAPDNEGNGAVSGHVRVYSWNGSNWIQKGTDLDGENPGDKSGTSVNLSADGNTLAIGAPNNSDNGNSAGQVRVYSWNGSSWQQMGTDIDGEAAGDLCGYSVCLSADGLTLAAGARYNAGNGAYSGHTRIFTWNGTSWQQRGNDIDAEAAGDRAGYSVYLSADGNTLAIGATRNDGSGFDAGHVRVYAWDNSNWQQKGEDIDAEAGGDLFGMSISLTPDGNTIIIGAPCNDGNGFAAGHARVYSCNHTSNFSVTACNSYTYSSVNGTFTWTSSGIYTDTLTSVLGYDSIITIHLSLIADAVQFALPSDTVCASDPAFMLTGASPLGGIFSGNAVNGNSFDPAAASPGYNQVFYTYTDSSGCQGTDSDSIYVSLCTGLNPVNAADFSVELFPNPSGGQLNVNTRGTADQLIVTDMLGNEIISLVPLSGNIQLDLGTQPDGIYFIHIRAGDLHSQSRFVLSK